MNISEEAGKEYDAKTRDILRPLLAQCTPKQVDLFNRMYGSIDTIPAEKTRWAYIQLKNTLVKKQSKKEKQNGTQ